MPRARLLGLVALLAIPFAPATGRASTPPSLIVFAADLQYPSQGSIYRVDPNGHRVDLSRNPFEDHDPLVSPDGKEVAFFSYRNSTAGQAPQIFEERSDGTHLTDLAPALSTDPHAGTIAWQPHGDRLAAVSVNDFGSPNGLWILRRGHEPKQVLSGRAEEQKPSWSPDGRVLVAASAHAWRAFSPTGHRLWARSGPSQPSCCGTRWSTHDLLAIMTRLRLRVFDEKGHKRFEARVGKGHVSPPAWSPNGGAVAFLAGSVVEVRTAKGRLVVRKRLPSLNPDKPNVVVWAGARRVVAGVPVTGPQVGVDVRTGKLGNASPTWLDPRSRDGKLAIVTHGAGANITLGVEPVGGGPAKTYETLPGCAQTTLPVNSLQFVGHSRSVVYANFCTEPFTNLYAMSPDGTGLRQLTALQPNIFRPVLSPDGTKIAYGWSPPPGTGSKEIRVANVDGTDSRVLTNPGSCFLDETPSWSPDGETILYDEYYQQAQPGCDAPTGYPELYTIPAAGGTPHDLGIAGGDATWGPTRIAYTGANGLTTANPDGSDPVVVSNDVSTDVGPRAWSPDGRLAYTMGEFNTTVVVGDSSVKMPFSYVRSLAWSADGTHFVVAAETGGYTQDVYTVGTDGSDPVRLTTDYGVSGVSWR
ncbi:MAG TPA: hypothetical protein VHS03_07370 [Gaiellaceae bacterium]|nr:hypothetical protein [Gaiellaceae bacterium]